MENSMKAEATNVVYEILEYLDAPNDASASSDNSDIENIDHPKSTNFAKIIDLLNDEDFKSHMRVKRSTVDYLILRYSRSSFSLDEWKAGRPKISCKIVMYMYVWYMSNLITYTQLANLFGVTKSSAWKVVNTVTHWLMTINHEFIKWPEGAAIQDTSHKFEAKNQIPGVIGAIGCTHIAISPPTVNKTSYLNRKNYYSLVLQAVVDADKKFMNISCGEPGSLHNSSVLKRSELFRKVEENYQEMFPYNTFIIGNSAYFANSWLVPPFKDNGNLCEAQRRFNDLHSSTQMIVKNAFKLLKSRFRRLLKFTEHRDVSAITDMIVSACVLHNICIVKGDLYEDE